MVKASCLLWTIAILSGCGMIGRSDAGFVISCSDDLDPALCYPDEQIDTAYYFTAYELSQYDPDRYDLEDIFQTFEDFRGHTDINLHAFRPNSMLGGTVTPWFPKRSNRASMSLFVWDPCIGNSAAVHEFIHLIDWYLHYYLNYDHIPISLWGDVDTAASNKLRDTYCDFE